ncbi:hypothetical protein [Nitrobacter hamburgensis]|jgi:hypothetical protein|uniref:hypothetical protein n=1 Tax=Nitrobacter hamburgensis TaxID=912 RepID=UPI00059C7107|nr:hypothetical protein [Nitrobacter hamburgensis]
MSRKIATLKILQCNIVVEWLAGGVVLHRKNPSEWLLSTGFRKNRPSDQAAGVRTTTQDWTYVLEQAVALAICAAKLSVKSISS